MEPAYLLAVCIGCFSQVADQEVGRFIRHRVNPAGCFRVDHRPPDFPIPTVPVRKTYRQMEASLDQPGVPSE